MHNNLMCLSHWGNENRVVFFRLQIIKPPAGMKPDLCYSSMSFSVNY